MPIVKISKEDVGIAVQTDNLANKIKAGIWKEDKNIEFTIDEILDIHSMIGRLFVDDIDERIKGNEPPNNIP